MDWSEIPEDIPDKKEPEIIRGIDQGSDEWKELRLGYITGSTIAQMIAGGKGLTKEKLKVKLALERMTGKSASHGFKSAAMKHGNDCEGMAREHYEFFHDCDVEQVTFIKHPTIEYCGASPDGLVNDDGLLEIKNPDSSTHLIYLLEKKIPRNYFLQMQWQLACSCRKYCDFMSFDVDFPIKTRAIITRVYRDENIINELENNALVFLNEINLIIESLINYE